MAQYGALCIDLGLCFPENNAFVTRTKVATRKLNRETPFIFALNTKNHDLKFFSVNPKAEFSYITKLPEAKFYISDGIPGILIKGNGYGLPGMTSSE